MATLNPVDAFDLVIFGGSGDLALRKLLPALYHRHRDDQFTEDSRIIAVGRSPMSQAQYCENVLKFLSPDDELVWRSFQQRLHYLDLDALDISTWQALQDILKQPSARTRIAYLATPPTLFGPIAHGLDEAGLIETTTRVVLEKPVGEDYDSAQAINDAVGACFAENQ